jgi:hypothetical protein
VLLGQGEKPQVGKSTIQASLKQNFAANPNMKALKYVPEITDLQVVGDAAYEWGFFEATHQLSADSKPATFRARFLRVMRLQIRWLVEVCPRDVEHRRQIVWATSGLPLIRNPAAPIQL